MEFHYFVSFFFLSRNYYEHGIHRNYMYLKYRKNCHKILKKSYANFLNELSLAQKTWCVLFEMTSILGSQLQLHFRVSFPFMILKYNSTGSRLYVVTLFLILNKCYSWVFFFKLIFCISFTLLFTPFLEHDKHLSRDTIFMHSVIVLRSYFMVL